MLYVSLTAYLRYFEIFLISVGIAGEQVLRRLPVVLCYVRRTDQHEFPYILFLLMFVSDAFQPLFVVYSCESLLCGRGTLKCYRPAEGPHSAAGDSVVPVLPTHFPMYINRNKGSVFIPLETEITDDVCNVTPCIVALSCYLK